MEKKNNLHHMDCIASLFDTETMSVHIVQGKPIVRKQGRPGARVLQEIDAIRDKSTFKENLALLEGVFQEHEKAYKEIVRKHSEVRQIGPYRIVLVAPPVAPVRELTIVRPLVQLSLPDYNLPDPVISSIQTPGHGILIAGSPGEGKTTFAQALLQSLDQEKLIIKTIEAPRDVQIGGNVTQYGLAHTTHNEIRDILLLTRPDITLFDEVRNKEDFHLYKDLRLAGIGLIGVMHATTAVDAIQRTIGVIEMGLIAQIIDTVIFIKGGAIQEVLTVKQVVKVPVGMQSADLSRPVLIVSSALQEKALYEIYTYSDNVVVMPLDQSGKQGEQNVSPLNAYAEHALERKLQSILGTANKVTITGPESITLFVPASETGRVIGKGGAKIDQLQKQLGLAIKLKSFEELRYTSSIQHEIIPVEAGRKQFVEIHLPKSYGGKTITVTIAGKDHSLTADNYGVITIKRKKLVQALLAGSYAIV